MIYLYRFVITVDIICVNVPNILIHLCSRTKFGFIDFALNVTVNKWAISFTNEIFCWTLKARRKIF